MAVSGWLIGGSVASGVGLILLIGLLIYFCCLVRKKWRERRQRSGAAGHNSSHSHPREQEETVEMSSITQTATDEPQPNNTRVKFNREERTVIEQAFKHHHESPPVEPSAPPLDPDFQFNYS